MKVEGMEKLKPVGSKQSLTKYRISEEYYSKLYNVQNGKCAICGSGEETIKGWKSKNKNGKGKRRYFEKYKNLAIDHNHTNKIVRGLLCSLCNMGLGLFKDNPELLVAAAAYIKNNEIKVDCPRNKFDGKPYKPLPTDKVRKSMADVWKETAEIVTELKGELSESVDTNKSAISNNEIPEITKISNHVNILFPKFPDHSRIIYTDGFCEYNPGNGSFYFVEVDKNNHILYQYGERVNETTNNRMELMAVISALECFKRPDTFVVYSDSQYAVKGINSWMKKWQKKNFAKIKNPDLWKRLYSLCEFHEVYMYWVKGHNGNKWNEYCDEMCLDVFYRDEIEDNLNYSLSKD